MYMYRLYDHLMFLGPYIDMGEIMWPTNRLIQHLRALFHRLEGG